MKLREHPGIKNWPPDWLSMSGSKEKQLRGEAGTITNVSLSRIEPILTLYLTIEYEGDSYMGTLLCKDAVVCRIVHDVLQKQIGKPVKQIGELDLSHTL